MNGIIGRIVQRKGALEQACNSISIELRCFCFPEVLVGERGRMEGGGGEAGRFVVDQQFCRLALSSRLRRLRMVYKVFWLVQRGIKPQKTTRLATS